MLRRLHSLMVMDPKIVVLAGGVGGAKFVDGLVRSKSCGNLKVIGNVADDQEFYGLWVSPDIDTITYTLAGIAGPEGWGISGDTFNTLGQLSNLGQDDWMALGDRDLATHIYRTQQRHKGQRPSVIACDITRRLNVSVPILLPTDDPIHTRVRTNEGWLTFQDYFVRKRTVPDPLEISISGLADSRPTPEALAAIEAADLILIAPSNPIVSIGPILAIPGIRQAVNASPALKIAVSPMIGGRSVKGPADRMLVSSGYTADIPGILACYMDCIDGLVIDHADSQYESIVRNAGVSPHVVDILMRDVEDRKRLAGVVLDFARVLKEGGTV